MKKEEMPTGGLYEIICKIRDEAAAENRTLSGVLAELRAEIPPMQITRGEAKATIETYWLKARAKEYADAVAPQKF